LIFTLAYSEKIWALPLREQFLPLISFFAVIAVWNAVDNSTQVWLNSWDAAVSVGLGVIIFSAIVKHSLDFDFALSALLMITITYSFVRSWLFADVLSSVFQQLAPVYESYLQKMSNLKIDSSRMLWLQQFIVTYQTAIWGVAQITAVFLGYLLFMRAAILKHPVSLVKVHSVFRYLFIVALALTLYDQTHIGGINLLACLAAVYLIQGVGVLSYFWGAFVARIKMLRTLFIITIIINYPALMLIAFIGILDAWFDFRKLNIMEEKHESDSN
jgi:hypothetical protein